VTLSWPSVAGYQSMKVSSSLLIFNLELGISEEALFCTEEKLVSFGCMRSALFDFYWSEAGPFYCCCR